MAEQLGVSPDEVQFRFRSDDAVDHAAVTVDSFLDQSNATAVRIEPGDDARALLPHLDRIAARGDGQLFWLCACSPSKTSCTVARTFGV